MGEYTVRESVEVNNSPSQNVPVNRLNWAWSRFEDSMRAENILLKTDVGAVDI